jgi:hypothetical protein
MAVIKIVPMPGAEGQQGEAGAVGPQGPQGETGATGPAGADAVWYYNGEYNPGASYVIGDVVTYDGQLWYRKNANGGNVGDTPSEGLFWDLLAAKGADFNAGNGLVVTGVIDDPVINPAGTMSLSVQDGYSAFMDTVSHSAVFNGDVQITNLSGTRNTTIETPTIINNEVTIQTEYGEGWKFDNDGYILGPWLSEEEDPANTGRYLRVTGITRADNNPLLVSSSGPVLINGTGGEFLNFHGDPNNQIATIGDIKETALNYSNSPVPPTHHGSVGDLKNDVRYDGTHLYICVEDYTDGTAIIWKRINWASGNW